MRAANVTWTGISVHDVKLMDFSVSEFKTYVLRTGDILLAEASGSASEVGKPAVWLDQVPDCCFQNTLIRVRAPAELVPFLHLHFYKDASTGAFGRASRGVGIHHLGASTLSDWDVKFPPLPEQHRIVEAIESYFTRLDDAVATLERVQRNLQRYRAAVLKAAVEGRLVPTEAELARAEGRDYEPASVLLERILAERRRRWEEAELAKMKARGKVPKDDRWKAKYKAPVAPDTDDLPELAEGWCWASIDQLADHQASALTDGPFGSNLKTSHYTRMGPRVIRLQNIGDGEFINAEAHISLEHYQKLLKHAVHAGDVVIASLGDILPRACVVPDWLGNAIVKADCIRFAVYPSGMLPTFAVCALNSSRARKVAKDVIHGVGRPRIGLTLLRSFPLPVPPLREQERIVSEVERLHSVEMATLASTRLQTLRLTSLRQSILKWAFEGRLVDQDPTDEPASALLDRIKAERDARDGRKGTARAGGTARPGVSVR
ncbi:MAG: restriction endonuclease subunit S [Longimicrobiales bacterium]